MGSARIWSLGSVPAGPSLVWSTSCEIPSGTFSAIEKSTAWRFTTVIS